MKFLRFLLPAVVAAAAGAGALAMDRPASARPSGDETCAARTAAPPLRWHATEAGDTVELARWCRAVGGPLVTTPDGSNDELPALDDLVTVSWNAHLAEGDLPGLVADLRAGALTNGRPVSRFVLLVQELYRRGEAVPPFDPRDRTAFAITPRDAQAADVEDHAATLGLHLIYVPSMRNGGGVREDRGNAILSTEPLLDPVALELPLARQRRVALGAAVRVATPAGPRRLELVNVHLEPLSSPRTLWIFANPRGRQVTALLDWLDSSRYHHAGVAGIVLGGDFNTIKAGDREDGYRRARAWSTGLAREDRRRTHLMGRLDYLFFRSPAGWRAETTRLDRRFGSDHHPVLGTFGRD